VEPLCNFHYYANCAHTTAAAAKRFSYKFSRRKETRSAPSTFEEGSARFREKFCVESVAGRLYGSRFATLLNLMQSQERFLEAESG
jgi:hypothetical protein